MSRIPIKTPRRRAGIRIRVTVTAAAIATVTLLVGGGGLVVLLNQTLVSDLDAVATSRAEDISAAAANGTLGTTIPNMGEESSLIQVLGLANAVLASTANIEGQAALVTLPNTADAPIVRTLDTLTAAEGPFRVYAAPVSVPGGNGWVVVATSLAQANTAVANLTVLFAVGLPAVVAVLGALLYRAVGEVLRPVEAIRRQAAVIGAADLSRRVPVPPSTDEIANLARTMNEMLDRLEVAARRQNQFVADASHELRSPLAALVTEVDVALAHPTPDGDDVALRGVRVQAERMSTLISDLLYLARRAEARTESNESEGDLVDLDELVLAEATRMRERGGPEVEVTSVTAARIVGARRDLARLLRNLGDNALEHARSRITLALSVVGATAIVEIVDDGVGIPANERDRVFERFTRLDNDRSRYADGGGSGIGLAIVREIARDHGGTGGAFVDASLRRHPDRGRDVPVPPLVE